MLTFLAPQRDEIWRRLHTKFNAPSVHGWRCAAASEYKRPTVAHPLGDFYKILLKVCVELHVQS